MRPNGFLFCASIAVACACTPKGWSDLHGAVPPSHLSLFDIGPYLVYFGPGRVAVVVMVELDQAPTVEWWPAGTATAAAAQVRAKATDGLWVAVLTDLPVGERLEYRVVSTRGTTPTYRFKAGEHPGVPFRFALYGDTRSGDTVHRAVVEAIPTEHIDFVVHTGDFVYDGNEMGEWWRFFHIEGDLLARRPLLPTLGNHDLSVRGNFRRFFLLDEWADGRRYYSVDWGNLRIVAVDPLDECRKGCEQHTVLEKALEGGAQQGMLMAMLVHYPPYASGGHDSNVYVRDVIEPLARRYGVEVVLSGHNHHYERTRPIHGVTYIVSGAAGAPTHPVEPQPFTEALRTEPHHVLVDVDDSGLTLRAVNLDGDTFDLVMIEPLPPRGLL